MSNMEDRIRVLRILEYVGTRRFVEDSLRDTSVPVQGTKECGLGNFIQSGVVGTFPEVLERAKEGG